MLVIQTQDKLIIEKEIVSVEHYEFINYKDICKIKN